MEPAALTSRSIGAQHNPFEVLELGGSATARDISRQKDTLLGMLELGLERANHYASQLGERERTADLVRSAARELEQPRSRLMWELWLPPPVSGSETPLSRAALVLHHELLRELGNATPVGADKFDALGAAWDDVFSSDELHARIATRAEALEFEPDSDDIATEFGDRVRAELLTLLELAPAMDVDALESETASDVAHRFTDRKVELLELVGTRFSEPSRPAERRQQWAGLTREYEATVARRGAYTRRKAFEAIVLSVGKRASQLFNQNIDRQLALEAFTWLRDEAKVVGDGERSEFHAKNARIVRDRLQRDVEELRAAPRSTRGFGGRSMLSLAAIVAMAIARASSCSNTHHYDTSEIKLDPKIEREIEDLKNHARYNYDVPTMPATSSTTTTP